MGVDQGVKHAAFMGCQHELASFVRQRGESRVEGSFGSVRAGDANGLVFGEIGVERGGAHFARRFRSRSKLNTRQPRSRAVAATSASTKSTLRSR